MADQQETLRLAVGLARRSISLLESIDLAASAERVQAVVDEVLDANAWLRGRELTLEAACLAAGIGLGEALPPLDEVAPPADFEMPRDGGNGPTLVWSGSAQASPPEPIPSTAS